MSEERITSHTGGAKGQKLARFDLIPAGPLWQLAEVYGHGAKKYDENNWLRGYDWSLAFGALQRHAWAFWNGEDIDPEDGKPHMAAVAFHAFSLLEFMERHPDFDDRPNAEMKAFPIIEVPGMTGPGVIGDFSSFWPRRVEDIPVLDLCTCGHALGHHVKEKGACRPGFVCGFDCQFFTPAGDS